jgi:hypothetical protein
LQQLTGPVGRGVTSALRGTHWPWPARGRPGHGSLCHVRAGTAPAVIMMPSALAWSRRAATGYHEQQYYDYNQS